MSTLFEELHPEELTDALVNFPVVYVPCGPLEWHGTHLPFGNDALTAYNISIRLSDEIGGVAFPPLYVGAGGIRVYDDFPGTMMLKPEVLYPFFMNLCEELEHVGFQLIVLFTGHAADDNVNLLSRVASDFNEKHGSRVISFNEADFIHSIPDFDIGHADKWETSMLMALRPDLVRKETLGDPYSDTELLGVPGAIEKWRNKLIRQVHRGVWGIDPREASLLVGQSMIDEVVAGIAKNVLAELAALREG